MPADLAFAVDHFLVGQHGAQGRAPIHRDFRQIGQPLLIEFPKDPLRPSHVLGIRGIDFPRPIIIHAQGLELPLEIFNVPFGGLARMGPGFNRVLFRGQAERVPSHGVQHVPAPHPFVAGDDIGRDVTFGMTHVESGLPTDTGTYRAHKTWAWPGRSQNEKAGARASKPAISVRWPGDRRIWT